MNVKQCHKSVDYNIITFHCLTLLQSFFISVFYQLVCITCVCCIIPPNGTFLSFHLIPYFRHCDHYCPQSVTNSDSDYHEKIITLHCITLLHPLNFGMHYHNLATISLIISVHPHIIYHFKADGLYNMFPS